MFVLFDKFVEVTVGIQRHRKYDISVNLVCHLIFLSLFQSSWKINTKELYRIGLEF